MKLDTSYYKEYSLNDLKLFMRNAYNSSKNPNLSASKTLHSQKVNALFRHYKKRGGKLSLNNILRGE